MLEVHTEQQTGDQSPKTQDNATKHTADGCNVDRIDKVAGSRKSDLGLLIPAY